MRLAALAFFIALLGACAGNTPSGDDSTPDVDAGTSDGGLLPFMSECPLGDNAACESNLCFDFNAKGPHCTHACTVDSDCEAPSDGCNGMGVCKAPGGGTGGGTGGGGG